MKKLYFFILTLLITAGSCSKKNTEGYSFYHWKSNAQTSDLISEALNQSETKTI